MNVLRRSVETTGAYRSFRIRLSSKERGTSAFTVSGHSDGYWNEILNVSFRPLADIKKTPATMGGVNLFKQLNFGLRANLIAPFFHCPLAATVQYVASAQL